MNDVIHPTLSTTGATLGFIVSLTIVLISITIVIYVLMTLMFKNVLRVLGPLALNIIYFQMVYDACGYVSNGRELRSALGRWYVTTTPTARIILATILSIICIHAIYWILKQRREIINTFAIGESFDNLPMGIAFGGENGEVYQSNKIIESICEEFTGEYLLNANDFWRAVQRHARRNDDDITPEETPVIKREDNTYWLFTREKINIGIGEVYEYIAKDVTDEQNLITARNRGLNRLRDINKRLREYQHNVDDTVRREELLAAKMQVHDNMGTSLLTAKMYIKSEHSPVSASQVMQKWRNDLQLLYREGEDEPADAHILRLQDAASHLGIKLELMGELPKDFETLDLVYTGIQECMTNAFQHAKASQMYVAISKTDDEYVVSFSNNGEPVTHPVKEGGGLTILRKKAEKMGATIEYPEEKRFKIIMRIPFVR